MVRSFKIFILIILFFASALSADEFINIKSNVDKAETIVGSPVKYAVIYDKTNLVKKVELPPKEKVFLKSQNESSEENEAGEVDSIFPDYEITDIEKINRDEEVNTAKYVVTVIFYKTGTYRMPQIMLYDENDIAFGYKLPEVNVKATNEKNEKLADEPPFRLSGNYTRLIMLILGIIVLTAAVVLLIVFITKRLKKKKPDAPKIPPIEIFRKEISDFEKKKYIEKNEIENYSTDISHIFKKYISMSLKVDAVEMTTDEVYSCIENNIESDGDAILREIDKMIRLWDLSKFAEFEPSSEMLYINLNLTKEIAEKVIWEAKNVRFRV